MSSVADCAAVTGAADHVGPIYRKIAVRLIPILMLLWVLAWIDRVNVSFAKLQMMDELGFSDAVYGLGAGIFYIGYLLFEVPSNLLLQKIGARGTIARIAIGWGITCTLMALVATPATFYVLRFSLGAFEAGFFPGVILY
ncbi:MFS transporter, partial [Klebsiella pneumoniae]|uniref:MFS transporter n=1 Tax=Klebsiella pneumoniae TaxID=573 RepID=UPI003713461E